MPQGIKNGNSYEARFPCFEQTPKTVMAAVLLSLAERLQGEGDSEAAKALIYEEWKALYKAGVVPQKPVKPKPVSNGDIKPLMARKMEEYSIEKGCNFKSNGDGTVTIDGQLFSSQCGAEIYLTTLK